MTTLADKIRPFVNAISQSATAGDGNAKQVIALYKMHCSCPSDPGAPALCEAFFEDWKKEQDLKKAP